MKTYYNEKINKYYTSGPLKTEKGTVFNPTVKTLKANGYKEYVAPVVEIPADEQRKIAYENEIDKYIMAYIGYTLEGDTEKAEEAKTKYVERKNQIREMYPDE